ncbi:MAG: HWE histidine kinase domain-containing protein [Pseudomonadota bacterium]
MQTIDFEALFDVLPSPYMVLDRDLAYVAANAAYGELVQMPCAALIGRRLFDLFPDPVNREALELSLRRALEAGEPDTLAFIGYDMPRDGGVERRYFTAVHTPLRDADGVVRWVVQNTVDVTELQAERTPGGGALPRPGEKDLLQRAREAEIASRGLQRESARLRDLLMQAPGFMAVLSGPNHVFTLANSAYQQLIGHRDVIGMPVDEAIPEVRGQGFVDLLGSVYSSGEPFVGRDMPISLVREPGGEPEQRFLDFIYQPIRSPDGTVIGIFVQGADMTDRVRAEEQRKLLLDELNHRVKNTLATVQSIAAQTARTTPEPQAFRAAFEARLMALSGVHNLLTEGNWEGARLEEILRAELAPYGDARFQLDGPAVRLTAQEALTFALVTHELATNAAKYGALSTPDGCVRVDWRTAENDDGGPRRLLLDWREEGGPPVAPPTRQGFGSRLIERSIRTDMQGETTMAFEPDGLKCRISIRLGTG